ncbi:MAG: hypothetical protein ACI9LE_001954 [Paraglaciecola sp.]
MFASLSSLTFTRVMLLSEMWLVFLKWDLLVSFFNYRHWQLTFDKHNILSENKSGLPQVLDIIRLSEKVGRHHLRKMNCLRRCLCQKQLLEKRHYLCELHIGVKIVDGSLNAHAWLSHNKVLINDSEEIIQQYTALEKSANSNILSALRG